MKSFYELLQPETRLTPDEAILQMKDALRIGDKMMVLELLCPDNDNLLPDWDAISDKEADEWIELIEEANEFIY